MRMQYIDWKYLYLTSCSSCEYVSCFHSHEQIIILRTVFVKVLRRTIRCSDQYQATCSIESDKPFQLQLKSHYFLLHAYQCNSVANIPSNKYWKSVLSTTASAISVTWQQIDVCLSTQKYKYTKRYVNLREHYIRKGVKIKNICVCMYLHAFFNV